MVNKLADIAKFIDEQTLLDHLMNTYPLVYIALLKSFRGHEESLAVITNLFDDKEENYTWFVHSILLPKL